jgi:hypothetical protein
MIQIAINDKSKEAKALLEYLKNLSFVKILDKDPSSDQTIESPYDEEFVQKINKIIKKESFKELDPKKL